MVAFEVDRFEWVDERLVVVGRWFDLRGHRFMRPALTVEVEGEGDDRRLLADLEHKPWAADEGNDWIAAFPWDGRPAELSRAELAVAPSVAVDLPLPRLPGQRRKRAAKANAAREAHRPRPQEPTAAVADAERDATAEVAALTREIRKLTAERDAAIAERDSLARERDAAIAERDALARERDQAAAAQAASPGFDALIAERDAAIAERNALARERDEAAKRPAPADLHALAAERDALAGRLQRVVAERDALARRRDEAAAQRDAALVARNDARSAEAEAITSRDDAQRSLRAVMADRDHLTKRREDLLRERDAARAARQRDLEAIDRTEPPRLPPAAPRYKRHQSVAIVWAQRFVATGALALLAVVVYTLLKSVV